MKLERLGILMEPDPADAREAWGVLNPAAARGADGKLYLFPRLVAEGNYSRIGRARVLFRDGVPSGVERLGLALEPEEEWESKGVEDPRITRFGDRFLMAYTAYGPAGARVAIAASADLEHWERLGLAHFGPELDEYDNKDAAFFPEPVHAPDGSSALGLLHRPANEERPGIWVSFAADSPVMLDQHRRVAGPEQSWEALKIGTGPPPLRTEAGWLLLYHGVSGTLEHGTDLQPRVRYCAGAMTLDADAVWKVRSRNVEPLLCPESAEERDGIVPNVVFPTALDPPHVYYGMADSRIGVARLSL